jgi:cell division transport system permease protein
MSRLAFILKEVFRTAYRQPGVAIGSFLSLALVYLLFDIFWIASGTANQYYANLLSDIRMEVFLNDDVADSSLTRVAKAVDDIEGVENVEFVSKEQARQELANLVGTDMLVGYDSLNPLPRSFVFSVKPECRNLAALTEMEKRLAATPGVLEVHYSKDWLERMERARSLIRSVGLILGVIVLLTAIISSVNAIRLMTRTRAVGLQQMVLLGAGRLFTSLPFLVEGLLISGLGAAVSWIVVYYARQRVDFSQFELVLPALAHIALYCGAASLLGGVSGFLGIRKLLR